MLSWSHKSLPRKLHLDWFNRFYRAMLCMRGRPIYYGPVTVCVCVCVRLSVTSRCSTKTAKHRITQTKPHDSPGTLVLDARDLREIPPGSTHAEAPNEGGVGQNRRLSANNRLYFETVKHRHIVSIKVE